MSIQDVLDWQYGRKKLSKNLFKFSWNDNFIGITIHTMKEI
jgi:hypothetical protein